MRYLWLQLIEHRKINPGMEQSQFIERHYGDQVHTISTQQYQQSVQAVPLSHSIAETPSWGPENIGGLSRAPFPADRNRCPTLS